MKQVMLFMEFPDLQVSTYDKIMDELNASGALNNKGPLFHTCGTNPNGGLSIFDIWDSEESFNKFGETLMPLFKKYKVNMPKQRFVPLHNMVSNLVQHA